MNAAVQSVDSRNLRTGLIALGIALAMLGLGYASVPLYRIFCQVTGLGGTTQRVDAAQAAGVQVSDKTMSIRFDANTDPGLPWSFKPEVRTQTVRIGERNQAIFLSKNNADHAITGTASFNVAPVQAGKYFNKIQCFCFTEQTLQPGEEVRMPVLFYVDPAIIDDPDTADIEQITLSYTFYESARD